MKTMWTDALRVREVISDLISKGCTYAVYYYGSHALISYKEARS